MTVDISDPADPRLDDYRRLNDQPFRRRFEGDELFIAEGLVALDRLLDSGHRIRSVLVASSRLARLTHVDRLAAAGVPIYVAAPQLVNEIVGFDLHRGVVAAADRRPMGTPESIAASARRLAVLVGLNDGENLGAIARAARAFGIDALLLDPTCADPYSRRAVRVSMGEILLLTIARATRWPDSLHDLASAGIETWAMTPDPDACDLWDLRAPERLAVVLGAEGPGLDRATMAATTRRVRIPIAASVDSLNVGHAAAVTFAVISRPSVR